MFAVMLCVEIYVDNLIVLFCRAILESPYSMCKTCRHVMLDHEKKADISFCPLCHSGLH